VDQPKCFSAQSDVSDPKNSADSLSIYSTGGTILSKSHYSRLDNLAYGEHQLHPPKVEDVIKQVDEALDIAQLAVVNLPWAVSNELTSEYFVNISRHFGEYGCSEESEIVGGVVAHGTSTLAETVSIVSAKLDFAS
jgi:L-asparaginase